MYLGKNIMDAIRVVKLNKDNDSYFEEHLEQFMSYLNEKIKSGP